HLSLFFFLRIRPPPRSPLFPYTTLFRSVRGPHRLRHRRRAGPATARRARGGPDTADRAPARRGSVAARLRPDLEAAVDDDRRRRSEEHTSELQSRSDLVCRLLLEKKKAT